ncbi:SF1B family DNA helicase RecD2 [Haploplasma modicum]|uniref:SF1B family DNA helicase RecD2 n=1 Tax=Haploplasma modicum TaxID=2150 RepID=UPI00214B6AC6|nr:ATP-dependent RecD-like DNA helicase [Haploplasma modicum]MCR1808899.1 ATP-dependent RecD-like DNA helicase [Haploplasma modicum]
MDTLRIVAQITKYLYHNKENSYSIIKVNTEDDDNVTITGYIPYLSSDVYYEFIGKWVNHEKFGRQFNVVSYTQSETQSIDGLINYLSSSIFKGIGPVTARRIVDKLGNKAIKLILEDKSILKQFGFSDEKIEDLYETILDNQINEHILVELYGYNIIGKTAMKIINHYGILTIDKITANPYVLINDIEGIGFIKADEIAKKLKIEENDPRRIKAAIIYAMQTYSYSRGDIYMTYAELNKYTENILGFKYQIDKILEELIIFEQIIKEEDRYYLYNSYLSENNTALEIKRLINSEFETYDVNYLESLVKITETNKNFTYTEKQKNAIISSLVNNFSVITGGPGTGKTTIVDGILEVYSIYNNIKLYDLKTKDKIALMAPTGRAAKRMEEVLDFEAKTIHRHLGYGYDGMYGYDEVNQMPFDLIIIDESSMIDIFLAEKLFKSIKSTAKVIIVGDIDQLPSVSPGQVLKDLIESKICHVSYLNEIHRQVKDSNIIELAVKVNKQELNEEALNSGNDLFLKQGSSKEVIDNIINQVQGALNEGYSLIDDIQVLIPTYKGLVGIDSINSLMQEKFNLTKDYSITYGDKIFYVNDKVINLVNDPKNFIMNGDIGYITTISKNSNNEDFVIINFDGQEVNYSKADLENISLAYAMSVHKSQGSEYKIVILPLVRTYMHMLKKELLYTAITRAKNYLIILGDLNLLVYAANHLSEKRQTTLKLRLSNFS